MKKLEELSNNQLQKQIKQLDFELKRRKAIEAASKKITKILVEYGLNYTDIKITKANTESNKTVSKKPTRTKNKSQVHSVKPKYHDGNNINFWTGRGRAPKWVMAICIEQDISVDEFKNNAEYLLEVGTNTKS